MQSVNVKTKKTFSPFNLKTHTLLFLGYDYIRAFTNTYIHTTMMFIWNRNTTNRSVITTHSQRL